MSERSERARGEHRISRAADWWVPGSNGGLTGFPEDEHPCVRHSRHQNEDRRHQTDLDLSDRADAWDQLLEGGAARVVVEGEEARRELLAEALDAGHSLARN